MTKLEEVRAVHAARNECLKDGSHTCGGSCFALTAPRYAWNGRPSTPEARLRAEALSGDEEALDALLVIFDGSQGCIELYRIDPEEDDSQYGYGTSIVTHFGSQFSKQFKV